MNITWTLINYSFICLRKMWLFAKKIQSEHTSQNVQIGKYYHEQRYDNKKHTEIEFEDIKIDQIDKNTVIEYKKANTHPESAKDQLLFYLYKLKQKGVVKKGKIIFKENKWSIVVELTPESEQDLLQKIEVMKELLKQELPPPVLLSARWTPHKNCKWCSYFDFCHL